METPDPNTFPEMKLFTPMARLKAIAIGVGNFILNNHEVPLCQSSHYHREDFVHDPLASPIEQVVDWPGQPTLFDKPLGQAE